MSDKKEVLAYKWVVCNLKEKKAVSGFEFKTDANDFMNDFDDVKNYKVIHKTKLKLFGFEDPTDRWINLDKKKK